MKKAMITLFLLMAMFTSAWACEIDFKIVSEQKDAYEIGDEIIIEVMLHLTHRRCHVPPEETNFQYRGIKILGATPWKEVNSMEHTRKLKVQVVKDDSDIIKLTAERKCRKNGGMGLIEIKKVK